MCEFESRVVHFFLGLFSARVYNELNTLIKEEDDDGFNEEFDE